MKEQEELERQKNEEAERVRMWAMVAGKRAVEAELKRREEEEAEKKRVELGDSDDDDIANFVRECDKNDRNREKTEALKKQRKEQKHQLEEALRKRKEAEDAKPGTDKALKWLGADKSARD